MTIPLMPEPAGYKYLANDTLFNPINASVEAWKSSGTIQGNSLPWLLCILSILFIIQIMVYLRTESPSISAFPLLMGLLFVWYYKLLPAMFEPWVYGIVFLDIVLCISFEIGAKIYKQD